MTRANSERSNNLPSCLMAIVRQGLKAFDDAHKNMKTLHILTPQLIGPTGTVSNYREAIHDKFLTATDVFNREAFGKSKRGKKTPLSGDEAAPRRPWEVRPGREQHRSSV